MRNVAETIKAVRKYLKLTVWDLHVRTGLSTETIRKVESGMGQPYLSTVQTILNAMGCELKVVAKEKRDNA